MIKRLEMLVRQMRWSVLSVMTQRSLRRSSGNDIAIYYTKDKTQLLSELCDRYGSDKGSLRRDGHPYPWRAHTYADFYDRLLRGRCRQVLLVFECGIGTTRGDIFGNMSETGRPGASLRVWRDYFPNAEIFGADIDREVLFEDDRIRCFYIDQTDPESIARYWAQVGLDGFDLIVDDGLHKFEAGVCLFENSIDRLGADGLYVIEDVTWKDLARYRDYFAGSDYLAEFVVLETHGPTRNDNNLVVVRKRR